MDLAPGINRQITESARAIADAGEGLAASIAAATEAIVNALFADGRILVCGGGGNAALAQVFAAALVGRHDMDRPAIAAFALAGDATTLGAIAGDFGPDAVYARQIQALGRAGDILVVVDAGVDSPDIAAAILAGREQGLQLVALGPAGRGTVASMIEPGDVHVAVEGDRVSRIREIQLVALHALCAGIDTHLTGGEA